MNCKSSLPCQAADFRGFCFLFWNIHEVGITSPKPHTSHAGMSRWRLVTLVSVLLGGTGLMSNCRSAVKGSPKLQPPYLSENQREIHCCPNPKALIPLDGLCQRATATPGNSSLTSEFIPVWGQAAFFGGGWEPEAWQQCHKTAGSLNLRILEPCGLLSCVPAALG